jgi:hypothetical protein
MNVITSNPIIYSNTEGDTTTVKGKKEINPDVLKTGGEVLAGIGSALASRQRQYTDAEQRCGKKPLGKKNREKWQKCVDAGISTPQSSQTYQNTTQTDTDKDKEPSKKPMSKNLKIGLIAGGVVLIAVIGFIIYKKSK